MAAPQHETVQSLAESGIAHIPPAYIRPPTDRPSIAHNAFSHHLPLIDLSLPRPSLIHHLRHACSLSGFFHLLNHAVPAHLLHHMMSVGAQFFALPPHDKLPYACTPGVFASEGYGSRMLVKEDQVLDWRDYFDHHTLPLSRRTPTNWPDTPPTYRQCIEEYSQEMKVLAQRLLELISESLGLRSSYIIDAIGEPYQNVSLNYYPPCPQPELTLGLQSHSDLGAITILMQDEVGGLQVYNDNRWVAVQPIPDALVVNLGDQMQVTNVVGNAPTLQIETHA